MAAVDTRSYISYCADRLGGIALNFGALVGSVVAAYLLFLLFGGSSQGLSELSPAERTHAALVVDYCGTALQWASVAVVMGLAVRFLHTESVGQIVTLGGAAVYFGLPALYEYWRGSSVGSGDYLAAQVLGSLCSAGAIFLLPGIWHVLFNNLMRIWYSVQSRRQFEQLIRSGATPRSRWRKSWLPVPCWKTAHCRDAVRDQCPVFRKRKSCWKSKVGCLCDELFIRGLVPAGETTAGNSRLTASLRRERCRQCPIYVERQAAKYRVLTPLVFAAVSVVFYLFYKQMAVLVSDGVQRVDRFFAIMAKTTFAVQAPEGGVEALTVFVMVWLGIVVFCYAVRALEYFIFELQV